MKSFKEMAVSGNNLMIVDALNLAFRYKHAKVRDFAEDYLKTVNSLKQSYKSSKVIITSDQGSSVFRKGLHPEYKQNRKDKFESQTEEERLAFEAFFEDYNATLDYIAENTEYPLLRFKGVEADDIAAYITSRRKKFSLDHTWLISSDRDWDLLVKDDVSRFSYVTRKEVTAANWHDHYDCEPDEYISIKCLTGDTGDNVLGIDGIGPKRAAALVKEYGTAIDIYSSLPLPGKYKYIQNLNNSGELLMLNYQLMDLETFCEDAIGPENIAVIDSVLEGYLK